MTANCRRCHGFGSTLAPASRRIVNFLRFGRTAAIAGRSTPGSTPITNIEITIAAPVFPAETKAVAFPSFTSSAATRSEEHTSELQSRLHLVCRLLLEKKKKQRQQPQRNEIG